MVNVAVTLPLRPPLRPMATLPISLGLTPPLTMPLSPRLTPPLQREKKTLPPPSDSPKVVHRQIVSNREEPTKGFGE